MILGIETSCDETAAALVTAEGELRANVVASQADLHARYGGVVPEVASRRHLELVLPVIREALGDAGATLDDVTHVAVTQGPGLVGALLVGLSAAKALAWARRLPLVPVDHLHGHVASLYLAPDPVEPPFLCLLASGGHTLLLDVREHGGFDVLGTTVDDAAGEAFDKGARLLGLGYPGGAELELLARGGDPTGFPFPVARLTATTSPSRASRPRCSTRLATSASSSKSVAPTSQPRISARSCERWPNARWRRPRRPGTGRSPSSGELRPTRSSDLHCPEPASHRSRSARTTRR